MGPLVWKQSHLALLSFCAVIEGLRKRMVMRRFVPILRGGAFRVSIAGRREVVNFGIISRLALNDYGRIECKLRQENYHHRVENG